MNKYQILIAVFFLLFVRSANAQTMPNSNSASNSSSEETKEARVISIHCLTEIHPSVAELQPEKTAKRNMFNQVSVYDEQGLNPCNEISINSTAKSKGL